MATITIRRRSILTSSAVAQGGGDVTLLPAPASALTSTINPTVVQGPVVVAAGIAKAVTRTVAPTVIAGGLVFTPAPAKAVVRTVNPVVTGGPVTVVPTAAKAVAKTVNPTIVVGSIVQPQPAIAVVRTVAPVVVLGPTLFVPAPAKAVAKTVAPLVIGGGVTFTPAPSKAIVRTINPTVDISLPPIQPAAAKAIVKTIDPLTVLGPITISNKLSIAVAKAINPLVIGGLREPLASFLFNRRGGYGSRLFSVNAIVKEPTEEFDIEFDFTKAFKVGDHKITAVLSCDDGVGKTIVGNHNPIISNDGKKVILQIEGGEAYHKYVISVTMKTEPFAFLTACGWLLVESCVGGTTIVTPAPAKAVIRTIAPTISP